jgi:hypothetical protein
MLKYVMDCVKMELSRPFFAESAKKNPAFRRPFYNLLCFDLSAQHKKLKLMIISREIWAIRLQYHVGQCGRALHPQLQVPAFFFRKDAYCDPVRPASE